MEWSSLLHPMSLPISPTNLSTKQKEERLKICVLVCGTRA
uniref:Uncharacterized protein n=1 Tax=Arundo donax TaxID=35708 RepID=A0A0A9EHR7_ARUDO